jgi:chromosome segregation ATPase
MDEMRRRMATPAAAEPQEPATRSKRVEAAMLAIEETENEREQLRSALQAAEADLRGTRAELDALQLANSQLLTDMERFQYQREEAVSRLAAFSAVFDACLVIMQRHRGKADDVAESMEG